jgi:hypothetical protein
MTSRFEDCAERFRQRLLDFVWSQWQVLGVAAATSSRLGWFIDPEPLIPFSLELARRDPRVFDEILDWLIRNGHWVNVRRMVSIVNADGVGEPNILRAVAKTVSGRSRGALRWRSVDSLLSSGGAEPQSLFVIAGRPWGAVAEPDAVFMEYGLKRSRVATRGMSGEVPMSDPRCAAFLVRSLFGVGARADVVCCLAIRGEGHPSGISRLLGYSQKQVQDTLVAMANSQLVRVRPSGHRKNYRLDEERWWSFLYGDEAPQPEWVDWRALVRGLTALWRGITGTGRETRSDYAAASVARSAMLAARDDLLESGIEFSPADETPYRGEDYLEVFERDLELLAGRLVPR